MISILLVASQAFAALSYQSITMSYHFGEKRVEHVLDAKGSLVTTASDRETKQGRQLDADDLAFFDEKVKSLENSKDQISACRMSYVTFKVQSSSAPDRTFNVCRGTKTANAATTDKLLIILGATSKDLK